jgi:hypothetical protein
MPWIAIEAIHPVLLDNLAGIHHINPLSDV